MQGKLITVILCAGSTALAPLASAHSAEKSASGAAPVTSSSPANKVLSRPNVFSIQPGRHVSYSPPLRPRRWNLSADPLGWIFGLYGASTSYALSRHAAIRAELDYEHPVTTGMQGYEIDIGVPLYLRRPFDGPFVEPGILYRRLFQGPASWDGSSTVFGPQVLVGWQWRWKSGFDVAAAVGAGRDLAPHFGYVGGTFAQSIFPNGYLRIGYLFR